MPLAEMVSTATVSFPKWEPPKNKSKISGMILEPEKRLSTHQLSPAFHHDLTIKKPRSTARFSQKPQ
jgi:hypothetical protein